jgi:hypothetical protein
MCEESPTEVITKLVNDQNVTCQKQTQKVTNARDYWTLLKNNWLLTQLDGIGYWKRWLLDANVSTTDLLNTELARAISNDKSHNQGVVLN